MDRRMYVCTYVDDTIVLFRSLDQYHDLGIVEKKIENLRSGSQSKYHLI
jgi:hypothetical protein